MKNRANDFRIGQLVYHNSDLAPFKVTGIKKKWLQLKGDWSGGTQPINVKGWIGIDEVSIKPIKK